MPRDPDEYAVHLFFTGGQREEVRFNSLKEFQTWYAGDLKPKANENDFINVPIRNIRGEYMVVRPASIIAIYVEPVFMGSVERE